MRATKAARFCSYSRERRKGQDLARPTHGSSIVFLFLSPDAPAAEGLRLMAPRQNFPAFAESQLSDEDEAPDAERGLSEKEQSEVREAQRPRAPVVYEIIRL